MDVNKTITQALFMAINQRVIQTFSTLETGDNIEISTTVLCVLLGYSVVAPPRVQTIHSHDPQKLHTTLKSHPMCYVCCEGAVQWPVCPCPGDKLLILMTDKDVLESPHGY